MKKYNSIIVTKYLIMLSQCVLFLFTIFLYPILKFYIHLKGYENIVIHLLFSFYLCILIGFYILIIFMKLIKNIENNNVFTMENIKYLRYLSWASFIISIICFISSFYFYLWSFGIFISFFMGMILRVIKNVFEQAILIKEENDFTV